MNGRLCMALMALAALAACEAGEPIVATPIEDAAPPPPGRVDQSLVDQGLVDQGPDPDADPDAAPDATALDAAPDTLPLDARADPDTLPLDASADPDTLPLDASADPDTLPPDASADPDAGPPCVAAGGSIPVVPDAPSCCPGLEPIPCDAPAPDGECPGRCVGATVCAACGDGACGPGENRCNCPDDCADTCAVTADCLDHPAPIRCVGQWRCDRAGDHPADDRGPDGCAYQCLFSAPGCDADIDCPADDICRDCPMDGACDDQPRVCSDPAYGR